MERSHSTLSTETDMKKCWNLLCIVLASTIFLACIPNVARAATIPSTEQAKIRGLVLSHMRNMKNVSWTASTTFTTSTYTYTSGRAYKGIPYCQTNNTSYAEFLTYINSSGKMGTNCGVDCSTAALFSWKNASALMGMSVDTLKKYNTKGIIEEATKNETAGKIKMAGSYSSSMLSDTDEFTSKMTASAYKTMMSKLQTGDIAVYYNGTKGHAVVFIGFSADGIKYIDIGQGSLTAPSNSMWSESTMSYTYMQGKGYVPTTNSYFKSFSTY